MQGPTLTMPAALTSKLTFSRSHSSPNIPELATKDYRSAPATHQNDEIPRSASYACIPILEPRYQLGKDLEKVVAVEASIPSNNKENQTLKKKDPNASSGLSKEKQDERPKLERIGRRKSLVARPKSWIQRVKGGSPERSTPSGPSTTTAADTPPVPTISQATRERENKTRTVSESFATFARKSWMSSSRSPSPSRAVAKGPGDEIQAEESNTGITTPTRRRSIILNPKLDKSRRSKTAENLTIPSAKVGSTVIKTRQRPQSVIVGLKTFTSANSSTSSLPNSSIDNRSTPRTSIDKVPALPTAPSNERLQQLGSDKSQRRDELWSAFRSIENDFSKFQSKTWSLKTNVVRSSLLPFLRNHANHPSNKHLRLEDLDRRITILNKWWTGLLEVLDGRQNQTVSGVDRPILLDACYAIMTRPEWRLSPSQFSPLSERSLDPFTDHRPALPTNKSSGSLSSSVSQFMHESVHHNARNMFIQSLLTQMAYVVDKMSLRHAPASLVTFCGKAAAYAFFFVPGVAEVLTRVWKLQVEVLRRVSDELGMPRRLNKVDTDEVIAGFPAHMHGLGWTSTKSMSNHLQSNPFLPVMVSKVPWYGPWMARWCGRDSDLFFVFAKHYHVLAEEFMAPNLPLASKARAPGFILVQAQILTALDATIHRQPTGDPLPITFDDVLAGADASAAALPLPSNNSARPMGENRIILLLREFISERPSDYELARITFAESFSKIVQASAKRTSLYDHNACFVLADFLEEALVIFIRFSQAHALETDFIDWRFWLGVCQKMLQSENSMSEIRLFAFLFGSWNLIASDELRKEVICMEWLLEEDTFERYFCHWCPMVRAYYMRLVCWRLCRDDGEASELDTKIFSVVSTRIKTCWAHYLWLKQGAEKAHTLPPSTAPCHPAPGRRLLIIRNDNQLPVSKFLGFDSLPSNGVGTQPTAYKRHSSLAALTKVETIEAITATLSSKASDFPPANKKRWTFMNKVLSSSLTDSSTSSPSNEPPPSKVKTLEGARHETALARSRPQLHSKTSSTDSETPPATATHRAFSFKFSLEWSQHFERPQPQHGLLGMGGGSKGNVGFNIGSERRLSPPRLPAPAQAWLGARVPGISREIMAKDPGADEGGACAKRADRVSRAKYAGRALAEWGMIVAECNNFVERRRSEGVPNLRWVEVPTLGVEGFRRMG